MRRWRDLAVVAIGAAILVTVLVIGGGSKSERATPTTTTTSTTIATTTTGLLKSVQLGTPSGVRLLVTGAHGVVLVELDTGLQTLVAPSQTSSYSVLAHGVVAQDGRGIEYLGDSLEEPGLPLGTADVVVPSPRLDRMWLVGYGPLNATAREVDTDGAVTAGPFEIPAAGVMHATDESLVTSINGAVEAFDRRGASRTIGTGQVLAAGSDAVVVSSCAGGTCALSVIDATTGSVTAVDGVAQPGALQTPPARISPDGKFAAVFDVSDAGDRLQLRLVELATGRVVASGLPLESTGPALLSWSRDSKWVFVANGGPIHAMRVDGRDEREIDIGALAPATSLAAI